MIRRRHRGEIRSQPVPDENAMSDNPNTLPKVLTYSCVSEGLEFSLLLPAFAIMGVFDHFKLLYW